MNTQQKKKTTQKKSSAVMELKKSGTQSMAWHQFQYTSKDAQLIIDDYKQQYKVNPARGHLMVIEQRGILTPYITKSGHCSIANANKISTKIQILSLNKTIAQVKCTAILPDGTYHEAIGISTTAEKGRDTINKALSMATTRARNNAIDAAMEIQYTPFEEYGETDEIKKRAIDITEIDNERLSICPSCKEKGWSRIQKKCNECGITYEQILEAKK